MLLQPFGIWNLLKEQQSVDRFGGITQKKVEEQGALQNSRKEFDFCNQGRIWMKKG